MFPIRSVALIVALTLSTIFPLAACAQQAPVPEAAPQAAQSVLVEQANRQAADEHQAARLIAERLDSGQPLFEDWTWEGMPPVVGAFNQPLLDEWEAAGRPDAS